MHLHYGYELFANIKQCPYSNPEDVCAVLPTCFVNTLANLVSWSML